MRRNLLLLVFVTLACIVAYDNHRRGQEERRMRSIERLGGFVDHGGRFIVLGGRDITDTAMQHLQLFPELEYLALPDTAITPRGISELRRFKLLIGLELPRTPVDASYCAQLVALPRLKVLKMIQTGASDECLTKLSRLSQLEVLDLSNCPISGDGVRHLVALKNLRMLSLSSTKVGDACIVHLKELPRLQRVDLDHTRVTLHGVSDLQRASPACQITY
jgi:hypothetical protein